MKRAVTALATTILLWGSQSFADDPRVHVAGGGAHALGGTQSEEFGTGGSGSATVELPATSRLGVQASAGAFALSKGAAPSDATIAPTKTGIAFLGTMGVRMRAYGRSRVAGPWIDSNVGVAHTGDVTRPAFDAHLGWDIRVSRSSRLDVGPFLGYTQIFQPDAELRGSDARILTAGLSISLGAKETVRPLNPGLEQTAPPPPPPPAFEPIAEVAPAPVEVTIVCPDGAPPGEDGCGPGVRIFENRILLDDVIHFEFDRSIVRPKSIPLLQRVASFIQSHQDIVDVSIEGHADEVGTEEYNQKLSEDRARSIRALLVKLGVDRNQLRIVAHGKSLPKIVTLKPERENRRVEMFVTRSQAVSGTTASSHGKSSR